MLGWLGLTRCRLSVNLKTPCRTVAPDFAVAVELRVVRFLSPETIVLREGFVDHKTTHHAAQGQRGAP